MSTTVSAIDKKSPISSLATSYSSKHNKKAKVVSRKKSSNRGEINLIENRIAGLLKATSAVAVKSTSSAVYLLIKNLVKKGENVVTLNSLSLFKNEVIRERLGVEVKLSDDESLSSFKSLVDEHTKLIFLESLGVTNHIIPDFQKIISFAHSKNIAVAVDNTIGLAGNIFNPITWGADYSIENVPSWIAPEVSLKTFLLERIQKERPITEIIKAGLSVNLFQNSTIKANELDYLPARFRNVSSAALSTARWIKEVTHIKQVEFVGFQSHFSHFNALKYFSGGYGNVISFSLWANYRSFDFFLDNLVPRSFSLFKIIDINYEQKRITISVQDPDFERLVAHFQHAFELLQKYLGSDYFLYENLYDTQDAVGY